MGGARKSVVKARQNGSILSFFHKTSGPYEDGGLFVSDGTVSSEVRTWNMEGGKRVANGMARDEVECGPFNESGGSRKRRRVNNDDGVDDEADSLFAESPIKCVTNVLDRKAGPFLEESDSEQEEEQRDPIVKLEQAVKVVPNSVHVESPMRAHSLGLTLKEHGNAELHDVTLEEPLRRPVLVKKEIGVDPDLDDFKDFEEMDDFDEDLFEEGDEYRERRYMEEQARLEAEEDEKDYEPHPTANAMEICDGHVPPSDVGERPACPICSISLASLNEHDAGVHVNNCLDGNPSPLPERKPLPSKQKSLFASDVKSMSVASASQYKPPVCVPKPGQANPFVFGDSNMGGGSAFTKLMSGHAEDAAWAEAAASEHASRGKPSYQRTCPFYKILPGLFICVDAFRYGAVAGCQAYFLSHFHSDHYVGLTSHWTHGPIYCSKVTANLVKQQLRVDPQFVIALEFEQPIELPGTNGVKVTMIPANHCPGSSLYLFEKAVGKKFNGEPKLQRILHCGDFRACRQHVEHPLLMPEVQCKVSGKIKEQKIDVCYLDTTYLNPKYAFPSQEAVIKACADMCVSLSKHTVDANDGWEQMKRERAGEGMTKFVRKESQIDAAEQEMPDGDTDAVALDRNPNASQQILRTASLPNVKYGRGRLLVVVGTYSIGKERICLGIARALNSKIYAPPSKQRIITALEDPELNAFMTDDPRAAQVHMTPLFEIRAETLDDYLKDYFPHFTRAVGFRPSGWNYRAPASRFLDAPAVATVLNGDNWKSTYSMRDLVPQRGSSSRASCFGVPYSEHSSFRELTMFCCALRIEKIVPTVNVGSAKSREKMKAWCERWAAERRKNGVWRLPEDGSW